MQVSLGSRVILEHGPITNVLANLDLIDQIMIANICKRTYDITVVQNTLAVRLPIDRLCDFPSLQIPSDAFVCKRVEVTIDGIFGEFYGIVLKQTDQPEGYGVFKVVDWVHWGRVKDGKFIEGRKVSLNKAEQLLQLSNQKWLADGSGLIMTELFSKQGVQRAILKDGLMIGAPIPRLNQSKDAQNWLSMQPIPSRYSYSDKYGDYFGEVNEDNLLPGRGIRIRNDNSIMIGYFEDGGYSTGHYIIINSAWGEFIVEEIYMDDGGRGRFRGTQYYRNGTEHKFDY
jgi:hypothetical protein